MLVPGAAVEAACAELLVTGDIFEHGLNRVNKRGSGSADGSPPSTAKAQA